MRWAVAAVAMLAACAGGDTPAGTGFDEALESGASCAELFELRNQPDPEAPIVERMNERLREIGCFSSASERTDD